ncbi:O-antigen ligase family protein [Streptomyces sp. 549]|uniref:O-antigen ligase family protein n=1 Tax=Streptomyces sp. 549 TaxID=3049076 RepID=UPI0024C307AE|nr:O-antigen ligase family protein [Streptomyces sp. 549]MDK1474753.1 O-antigen ligase family protein [Streptomyces sp. 549]
MASSVRTADGQRSRVVPVLTGAALLGATAAWALLSSLDREEARPEGVLLAVLAVAAGYAAGRIGGALHPAAAAASAAAAALVLAFTSGALPGAVSSAERTGEIAALLVLAAGAACCAAWAGSRRAGRTGMRLLAVLAVCCALLLGSTAGALAAAGVLLCSWASGRPRRRTPALAVALLAVSTVAGTTWLVAEDALPPGLTAALEGQVGAQRTALWRDAADIAVREPVTGSGPGSFGTLSPAAAQSPVEDVRPHSALLQVAAEQGVPGLLLLAASFGWLLVALGRSPAATPVVLTAAATLAVIAALACVSNALSFSPVAAGAGVLAGLATAARAEHLEHPAMR